MRGEREVEGKMDGLIVEQSTLFKELQVCEKPAIGMEDIRKAQEIIVKLDQKEAEIQALAWVLEKDRR